MKRSTLVTAAAMAAGVVMVVMAVGNPPSSLPPLSPASTAPDGTKAFVELMDTLGSPVTIDTGTVPASTGSAARAYAIVLTDSSLGQGSLGSVQRDALLRWTMQGGHLIVADPASPLASGSPAGRGSLQVENGPGPFTNRQLGQGDDATIAARLVGAGSGAPVFLVFPPVGGGGSRSLLSMLDGRTRIALLTMFTAFVLWASSRARRLGRPMTEETLVSVDGSVLTESMGRLMKRSGNAGMAARLLGESPDRAAR